MIVSLFAGLLALVFVFLSVNVVRIRKREHIALGETGIAELQRAVRAHANFAEYTPLFLILFGLAEHNGLNSYVLYLVGTIFLLGRVSHAFSLLKKERYENHLLVAGFQYRIAGMMSTFSMLILLSLVVIGQSLL